MPNGHTYLHIEGVCKTFSHVRALNNLSLAANSGEVLAIVGDNGAGKSTLIKILSGALRPDSGAITIRDRRYAYLTPLAALRAGISTVYQDLALSNSHNVAANIFLGHERMWGPFLDHKRMHREAEALIERLGIDIPDVRLPVSVLSGGQRQGVAIARAIHRGGRLFIFDEPTAAMGIQERTKVQRHIQSLAEQGFAVIIISHDLQQVFRLSHRVMVLRHGQEVACVKTSETTVDQAVALITGAA